MPIEITTRNLYARDFRDSKNSGLKILRVSHVHIGMHGYGRMDSSTPADGLATDGVASCLSFILHSPTTGRTILTHSPNFLRIQTSFTPMVDWVTGGDGKEMSMRENVFWFGGMGPVKPCRLEIVVLRGFAYSIPAKAKTYGHASFMQDFQEFVDRFQYTRSIAVSIIDHPEILPSGALLVDKETAHITILNLGTTGTSQSESGTQLCLHNPSLPQQYSDHQRTQDDFIGRLLAVRRFPDCTPIRLQYNISRYCTPHPLFDEARQLVRSKSLKEPPSCQSAIIERFATSNDWTKGRSMSSAVAIQSLHFLANAIGVPCEKCEKPGKSKCSVCRGAWYCGPVHQREDWPSHKAWCKSHPYKS